MTMTRLPIYFCLLCCLCLISCGGESVSNESASSKSAKKNEASDDIQFYAAVKHYKAIIPAVESADLVFYTDFGSASSGVHEKNQLMGFGQFITGAPGENPKECPFDGAAVLYDQQGNILCEMDFVITPGCEHVRLRMNNEYTIHGFTPQAVAFFTQFMNIIKNMNQG